LADGKTDIYARVQALGGRLVIEQKYTRSQAAGNLGIGVATLDNWLREHRRLNGSAGVAEELDLKPRAGTPRKTFGVPAAQSWHAGDRN
jgi:transposase-like protein